ncbi:(4Fe-4S)-binding protein [Amycolatopsis sp. lyj-112]|uniref:(4Fe-4S)-binding protein n=1 Tax=Amycolatopsis sp. lyj-112 TaxID=2789288 RepID=UPI00397C3A82
MTSRLPKKLADHPSVRAVLARPRGEPSPVIDAAWLKEICLAAGADDAAAVSLGHPDLAGEREHVLRALPGTKTLVSLVVRLNRDDVRSPARSVANQEFHRGGEIINEAGHTIVRALQDAGYRAINPSATFPMEMENYPGRIWVVAHKTVAVAAGLGAMGLHRNVIHPKFVNFVLLATLLVGAEVSSHGEALDYNPCLECKLCVAACPIGVSMWQSLAFKPNYKAAYCMAVCPAGEDVLGPYLDDRRGFLGTVVKPLQDKVEMLYVRPGSPAREYAERRFPHKPVKEVDGGYRTR